MNKSIYTSENKIFLNLLRNIRNDRGIKQVELAKRLKVPQSFVSKFESGERRLDIVELLYICKALGMNPVDFVEQLENAISES